MFNIAPLSLLAISQVYLNFKYSKNVTQKLMVGNKLVTFLEFIVAKIMISSYPYDIIIYM